MNWKYILLCPINSLKPVGYFIYRLAYRRISVTGLGHLLTRSGLTYPEVSSKVYHDSSCQLDSSILLPWVIYFEAFYLHFVSSFSCIPVICPKLMLFLTPLQFVYLFCNLSQVYPAVLLMYFVSAGFNIHKFYVLLTQYTVFRVDLRKTAINSLYSINWLLFITETECVYCAVRTEYIYI